MHYIVIPLSYFRKCNEEKEPENAEEKPQEPEERVQKVNDKESGIIAKKPEVSNTEGKLEIDGNVEVCD